jgi:hypothetical protein
MSLLNPLVSGLPITAMLLGAGICFAVAFFKK